MNFEQSSYTVAEGSNVTVKVTLDDDPERTVSIPIDKANQGGASSSDYSGVPSSVTFNSGDTEKTLTFTAASDTLDDDGESVKVAFGTLPTTPVTVTAGTFERHGGGERQNLDRVNERRLSDDQQGRPGRGNLRRQAYPPTSLSAATEKTFTFTSAHDTVDDDDESVK